MQQILITGANRGIGLEFVGQYAERGDMVFATARDLDAAGQLQALHEQYRNHIALISMDVEDQGSIEAAVETVRARADALDVLINNAGVYLRGDRPGTLKRDQFRKTFEINVIGPAMVVQSILPLLRAGQGARVLNMSSDMGSISNAGSGAYSYRISKAAVNMLSRVLANDLRAMGIIVIAMDPGCVQTDMGGKGAPLTDEESVQGMIGVLDGLTPSDSGGFFDWNGQHNEW